MKAMKRVVASKYIHVLKDFLSSKGYEFALADLFQGTNVSQIQEEGLFLTMPETSRIIENALHITGDEHLGLDYGRYLSIEAHSFLGIAMMSANTFDEVLKTALKYLSLRTQLIKLNLRFDGEWVAIDIQSQIKDKQIAKFIFDTAMVNIFCITDFLIGISPQQCKFDFQYPAPLRCKAYFPFLGQHVRFHQAQTCLMVHQKMLYRPLASANAARYQQAHSWLYLQQTFVKDSDSFILAIERLIECIEGKRLEAQALASAIGISSRSLRRHLQAHETSYKEIQQRVLSTKALRLLEQSDLSIEDISFLLGYENASNFIKAYRHWYGISPQAHRRLSNVQ